MPRPKPLSQMKAAPWIRVELWGIPKSTKSSWALTAPPPIDFFAWDQGYELLIHDLDRLTADGTINLAEPSWEKRKDQIYPYVYPSGVWGEISRAAALKELQDNMQKFAEDFQDAVKAGKDGCGGSIVVDGGTQLHQYWNFRVDAEMEEWRAKRIFGSPWSKRNKFFKAMLDLAKGCNRHLILIHHDQDVWKEGAPTGDKEAAGDRLVEREVDLIMQTTKKQIPLRDANNKVILSGGKPKLAVELGFKIEECRPNSSCRNLELPWMPFDDIYSLAMD